jgi:flagellar basal-body rod protein FlgB
LSGINSSNFAVMQKDLDALWLRQKVISNNIANVDTPGYKSQKVDFEDVLSNMLNSFGDTGVSDNQIQSIDPTVSQDNSTTIRADGNNVDIDAQNVELVRTQMQYETMIRLISSEISRERYAVTEGRR